MKLAFLTSTPLNIAQGSGTFNGMATLARALQPFGVTVHWFTPTRRLPVYTLERIWFNHSLRRIDVSSYDAVVGFDLDGYTLPKSEVPHVAAIKGVIRDEARFERGFTRWTMLRQAVREQRHVRQADRVIVTGSYAAQRVSEYYAPPGDPIIVPELIDLERWRALMAGTGAVPDPSLFTVLCVCRLYRRKRVEHLLEAAAQLSGRIPALRVRIVGDGPEGGRLRVASRTLHLENVVTWLGNCTDEELASEYRGAHVFCLPSVQEGFGIVFLEAMAAGLPIVAARAASTPEVLPQGLLAEPESAESLANGLARLAADSDLRRRLAAIGRERVKEFDAPRIAARFLDAVLNRPAVRRAAAFSSGDESRAIGPDSGG